MRGFTNWSVINLISHPLNMAGHSAHGPMGRKYITNIYRSKHFPVCTSKASPPQSDNFEYQRQNYLLLEINIQGGFIPHPLAEVQLTKRIDSCLLRVTWPYHLRAMIDPAIDPHAEHIGRTWRQPNFPIWAWLREELILISLWPNSGSTGLFPAGLLSMPSAHFSQQHLMAPLINCNKIGQP